MALIRKRSSFWREFKREIKYAIISAVGFSIAFAWRESLLDLFQDFVARLLNVEFGNPLTEVYASIAITFAGVLVIFMTSKLLRD